MEKEKILSSLCIYDSRNPNYYYDEEWGIGYKEPPKNCKCDNCFYGRSLMANDYLELIEVVEKFVLERDRCKS